MDSRTHAAVYTESQHYKGQNVQMFTFRRVRYLMNGKVQTEDGIVHTNWHLPFECKGEDWFL